MLAGPTLTNLAPVVAFWHDQIERLSEHASPIQYLLPAKWAAMRGGCLALVDEFGAETYRLGWTAPQLFGIHPEYGTLHVDYCEILMVDDRPVIGVENTRTVFDRFSGYRTKPGQVFRPPIWEFAAGGGRA